MFFGAIQQRLNNTPPGLIPHKGEYIAFERDYWASRFNVPMSPGSPKPFPQLTLHVMRAITAVTILAPSRLNDVLEAMERKFWVEHAPVSKPEVYGLVIREVLGEELGERVLGMEKSGEVKGLLTERTEEAFAQGAFGIPWFAATNGDGERRCFWGVHGC